jgi:hypothetical protein
VEEITSYTSSMVTGWSQPETPEVCESNWRPLIPALPRDQAVSL